MALGPLYAMRMLFVQITQCFCTVKKLLIQCYALGLCKNFSVELTLFHSEKILFFNSHQFVLTILPSSMNSILKNNN